jgi:hypothetical protein
VLAETGDASEAESWFQRTIDTARSIPPEARRRSHGSCAWRPASPGCGGDQGRRAEAHDLLAPVYSWFAECFDTADLKDAKALLDELA